ncbi:hypothetical protein HMPREF2978_04615 [Corynebacterium sp. HMSC074C01]|uniref:hypothetical protein n=1 Tax=Corynebacterium sp. HMSC074C01 TaxID=1739482 RepID=UPI0008A2DCE1|nr:hypothetical protein [Corynebacterium sp. HMSC074C01]OFP66467.1 hypothetical protein HMPREF2978_04615 [Corynebacterium sp. HMSC074C01]
MTITPNDLSAGREAQESTANEAGDKDSKFVKATKKVKLERRNREVKSIIYETSHDADGRRLLVDRHSLPLPAQACVHVDVEPDGTGIVSVRIPAARVQVIPAGKKITNRRTKRAAKKEDE